MPDEKPLTKAWKRLGIFLITQSLPVFFLLSNNGFEIGGDRIEEGLQISVAFVASILLLGCIAVMMQIQRIYIIRTSPEDRTIPWPPTHFETDVSRDPLISKVMLFLYYVFPITTLVACLTDYSKSVITKWRPTWERFGDGFWDSRYEAHFNAGGYDGSYGIAENGWEYYRFFNDPLLLLFAAGLVVSFIMLIRILKRH